MIIGGLPEVPLIAADGVNLVRLGKLLLFETLTGDLLFVIEGLAVSLDPPPILVLTLMPVRWD